MEDVIFCQNCQRICRVIGDFECENCGEMVCLYCGCTDSEPCAEVCEWARDGVCSNCEKEVTGMKTNALLAGMKL